MTEVRMIVPISGTRNGQRWPAPGGTVDLPAEEAAAMTAAGMASTRHRHGRNRGRPRGLRNRGRTKAAPAQGRPVTATWWGTYAALAADHPTYTALAGAASTTAMPAGPALRRWKATAGRGRCRCG